MYIGSHAYAHTSTVAIIMLLLPAKALRPAYRPVRHQLYFWAARVVMVVKELCKLSICVLKLIATCKLSLQGQTHQCTGTLLIAGGGVWGRSPTADCSQAPSVSDEDLQAQAWFPATLTSMLHLAELAASITLDTCELTLRSLPTCSALVHSPCIFNCHLSLFCPCCNDHRDHVTHQVLLSCSTSS